MSDEKSQSEQMSDKKREFSGAKSQSEDMSDEKHLLNQEKSIPKVKQPTTTKL